MSRERRWLGLLVFAAVILAACERIDERGARRTSLDFGTTIDTVPVEYGRLVAVSAAGNNRTNVALWFEGADQTLTAVRVNTSNGAISRDVIVVPRK